MEISLIYSLSFYNHVSIILLLFTNPDNARYLKLRSTVDNIRVVYIDWLDFVKKLQSKFEFEISLKSPYKLCDYKPAYGYIFQEYLSEYEYWGHCDCDLIWGNLGVLNVLIQQGYERIGEYGHLILYKNTTEVNVWFKTLKAAKVPSYQTVFSSDTNFSFDEFAGMNILVQANHKKVYTERLFDDIIFYKKNFWSRRKFEGKETKWDSLFFLYEKGVLFRYVWRKGEWMKDESLYVHFQKRRLNVETTNKESFVIIPDRIITSTQYSKGELKRLCSAPLLDKKYWTMWLKSKIKEIICQM